MDSPQRRTRKQEIIPGVMTWQLLERILKNYNLWYALYQEELNSTLVINGMELDLFGIFEGIDRLPPRQKEAVILTCIEGHKEADAARMMGFDRWSSQVGMYKRKALKTLCNNVWNTEKIYDD